MKRIILAAALLCGLASLAHAQDLSKVLKVYGGANMVWLDGPGAAWPVDFELGGAGRASLSPHISAVGGAWYGFTHSYIRGDIGGRMTATDVNDPNFNVYLGAKYRWASKEELRPNEWAPDAGFGWKPLPERWPKLVLGADASYGVTSNRVLSTLAFRYEIGLR